ncbi:MAG TPA: group I intron-associated PD-(D/E)XK endonuclease [Terriglobales bacterium]
MKIKHPKRRGEWAELRFMARAAEHGLQMTKPWSDSAHYDFVVENGGRFVRVQVKSTMHKDRRGYSCTVRGGCGLYKRDAFDFVAAYLIPEDLWYIIPAKKIFGRGSVTLYPKLVRSKLDCYKEAWHLLKGNHAGKLARVLGCADAVGDRLANLSDLWETC